MSAAAAMRPARLHGEPGSALSWASARDGTEVPVLHGLIRRLITVTDREGAVLSSGACTGMPPAAGYPVTCPNVLARHSPLCRCLRAAQIGHF
jgi:hypothetical protein